MRVYIAIIGTALALLAAMWLVAPWWVGEYLSTEGFHQTLFVEVGSFIATSAVVGGLSAAVADYLRRKELQPLRQRALGQIDEATLKLVNRLMMIMMEGPGDDHFRFRGPVVVSTNYRPHLPGRTGMNIVRIEWGHCRSAIATAQKAIDRFAASFSIERQDDLAVIEHMFERLKERMNIVDYAVGDQPGNYRTTSFTDGMYRDEYQLLVDALNRIAFDCRMPSNAAQRVGENIGFLANDVRYVAKALHAARPDQEQLSAIARSYDAEWNYGWTIEDMEARIVARVPEELLSVKFESVFTVYELEQKFGWQTVHEWKERFGPGNPGDPQADV